MDVDSCPEHGRRRQNSALHQRAKSKLHDKLSEQMQEYDALPENDKPTAKQRSIKLSTREHDLLQMAVDRLVKRDELIEYPRVTSRSRQFVVIVYDVDYVHKVLPEIEEL